MAVDDEIMDGNDVGVNLIYVNDGCILREWFIR